MAFTPDQASVQVRIGLVGAGKGGSALLDLLLDWPGARVAVVADPRSDAPALTKARALGIPTESQHLDVYAYPVNLVLEVTGQPAVLEDLLKARPPGVEIMGAASLRFFWDLVQDKAKATRQLVAQLDMAAALGSTLDLNQQIALIARKLAQACDVDRCTFYTWDETTWLVIPMMSQFATGERDEQMWATFKEQSKLKLADVPFLYEVIERRQPIEIEHAASNPLQPRGWADLFGTKSTLVVPFFRKDRVVGACTLDYCREARRFTAEQTAFALALAGQVSLALENTRLYQDAADKAKRLASLLETTKAIARVRDYSQLLSRIVQEAATVLRAEGAGIRILEGNELVYAAHYGYSMEGMRQRVALGESASGWVVQNNQPLATADLQGDPRVVSEHRAAYRREGFRSVLAVPMRIEDRAIGTLFVVAKSPRQFSAMEIEVLSGFADQTAIAINNARLYQGSETGRKQLASLVEVAQRLTRGLDLPAVLDAISAAAAVVFEAETGFRLVEGESLVRVGVTPGAREAMGRERVRIGESISGRVAAEGKAIITPDTAADSRLIPEHRAAARADRTGALMCVPVRVGSRVLGTLNIYRERGHRFDDDALTLAMSFADQAGIAIENARLYAETERRRKAAESLAELGRLVSQSLKLEDVGQRIVDSLRVLLDTQTAALFQLEPESENLVSVGFSGEVGPAFRPPLIFPRGTGVVGRAVLERRLVVTPDLLADSRITLTPELGARVEQETFRSVLAVPLIGKEGVIGALAVGDRLGRVFDAEAMQLAQAFADHSVTVLENARLLDELRSRQARLEALLELNRQLSLLQPVETLLGRIAEASGHLLGSDSVGFRLIQGNELVLAGSWGETEVSPTPRFKIGESVSGLVATTGEPLLVPDLANDPRLLPADRDWVRRLGYRAWLGVPVKAGERVLGVLSIRTHRHEGFAAQDVKIATAFASQAAIALENVRLYAEAERHRREAESLAELGRLLSQSLNVEDVGQRIVDNLRTLFKVETSTLFRMEPESGDLVALAFSGDVGPISSRNFVLPAGMGAVGLAVHDCRPVSMPNVLNDPRVRLTPELRTRIEQSPFRAVLAVPLLVKNRVIGALGIGDREGRLFSDEEIRLAQAFADQGVLALENARLFEEQARLLEETRRQHQEAVGLAEVAREITSSLEREEVLQRIVDRARELSGSDLAFLAPYDPETRAARIIAASGARTELLTSVTITPGRGTGGLVLETGEPFITDDYLNDPRITRDYAEVAVQEGFSAQAVVPLRVRGQTTGLLWVVNRTPRRFGSRDLTVLTKLADQAAIALENSRLYSELRTALTEVETSQQRIVQAERLRALGEMAAGVAHDFNNLLAVILGRAELLLARVHDPDLVRGLDAIRNASLDGAQTVRRIQEFTRTRRTRPFGVVDLWQLLQDVVELTRPRWEAEAQSRGVSYEVRADGGPVPPVSGIPEELREVFTNLLINALEAMPAGGRFVFRLTSQGDSVVVTAEDSGCGMSEETRRRVFEPFFTTKGPRGTGLGLSAAWGIVNRHGGTIEVESTPGAGSTFTVRLPITLEVPSEKQPATPPKPRKGVRVLVIDDEPAVREVVRDLLTAQGYIVIVAGDGAEGLARCEAEPVDLVLSDISMPGMSGWEVAAACWERFPTVPVGLITGWGDQLDPEQLVRHRIRFVLGKPFVASHVLREIASALEDAGTT